MATAAQTNLARFQYLLTSITPGEISVQTGISPSVLNAFARQDYALSSEESRSLRSMYGRTVYKELRDIGMSRTQAIRFEFQKVETIMNVEASMKTLVRDLSVGIYDTRESIAKKRGQEWNEAEQQVSAKETVLKGLRKSKKTKEEWEQYPEISLYEIE